MADRLADIPRSTLADAARLVTGIAEREGGTVGRFRLSARSRISSGLAVVFGVPAGPWTWVTTGTGRHRIAPRRRRALYGGFGHPVAEVSHPGGRGRGAWDRVEAEAERRVPELFERAVDEAVR